MERINVRVDRRVKQELEAEARERGVSPSEVVRAILERHLEARPKRENCLELARRLGLIGVFEGTPTDLSTNPEHMEGFGRD